MAAKNSKIICDEIAQHISKQGGEKKAWYFGIATDLKQRLHQDHQVPEEDYWYIWREAVSALEARAIEKAFLDWGCDGGSGGGDDNTRFVYAYLKSHVTNP